MKHAQSGVENMLRVIAFFSDWPKVFSARTLLQRPLKLSGVQKTNLLTRGAVFERLLEMLLVAESWVTREPIDDFSQWGLLLGKYSQYSRI